MDDLQMDLLDIDAVNLIHEGNGRRKIKAYKQRNDPFLLSDIEFRSKCRLSKEYVRNIVDIVREDLQHERRGGTVSCELQVLIALRTWARNEVQDDAADIHGVSQQSVSNICNRVAVALARRARHYIKMPETPAQQQEVMASFRRISGFRNVIGAIDCTHIRLKKVGGEASQYYINRKGYYSLNVQVVCDATLRIRDIVAHWRGSTHDSRIFRESLIKRRLEAGEFRGRLLGDSGYPCTPHLFTPVLNPNGGNEERYNRAHIRTRNVVERCFGVWKQRFRCLLRGFSNDLQRTKTCIVALAVLHNIALEMGEVMHNEEFPDEDHFPEVVAGNVQVNGQAARAAFINMYF